MAWTKTKASVGFGLLAILLLMAGLPDVASGRDRVAIAPTTTPSVFLPPADPSNKPASGTPDATKVEATADVMVDFLPDNRGWVATLPGSCTGAPVLAHLDGDGKRVIIVPVIGRQMPQFAKAKHPRPSMAGQLFAFRADGKPFPGWPVVIISAERRMQRNAQLDWWWNFSPSVADVDGDGADELVMPTGDVTGTSVINGDGKITSIDEDHGDPWGTAPLIDLDGDGTLDVVMGWTLASTRGGPVPGWPTSRLLRSGYGPAVGDFLGTGKPCVYHPHYVEDKIIGGYDNTGQKLPGWPVKISGTVIFVSAGDLDGDGKAECIAAGQMGGLHVWKHDGTPMLGPVDPAVDSAAPEPAGAPGAMFVRDLQAGYASPAIADVDGDGRPEVVVWDTASHRVRAFGADGHERFKSDVLDENARGGVSVGDIGGDGIIDLFVGTTWLTFDPKTNAMTQTPMLGAADRPETTSQPTICDADDDGLADVLIGTTDGRLVLYRTGLSYHADRMQWPTQSHDFHHTGFWTLPRPVERAK